MEANIFLGNLLIIFGFIKIIMYLFRSRLRLARLELLIQKYGEKKGTGFYFLIYTVAPITIGFLVLLGGKLF